MKKFEPGKKSLALFIIVISVILLAGIPAASAAYTAALTSSTTAYPGSTVTITIGTLSAGDHVTVNLSSTNLATTGGTITFTNFVMPFGFDTGTATTNLITTGNAGQTKLSVTKADNTVLTAQSGTGDPNTITSSYDITAQTYKTISIEGVPAIGSSTIGIVYNITGTSVTTGGAYTLTFTITGVKTGDLRIRIPDGGLDTTINIIPVPPPTPVSSEGGGGPSSPSAPAAVVAPVIAPVVVVNPVIALGTITTTTTTLGAGGTFTDSTTVDVGSGTVSFSPGTVVTTNTGSPATTLVAGSLQPNVVYNNFAGMPVINLRQV